jgi:DNA polymerase I-like protein with 3'-5' exonuclease and polymerase domains
MQLDLTRISVPVHPHAWLTACAAYEKTLDTPDKHADFVKNRYDLWPHLMQPDGRLHPTWDTTAWTGRISASSPAVQNIPKALRAGIATPGKLIVAGDWRGCHLRILGHHSGDAQLVEDLHGDVYAPITAVVVAAGVEPAKARKVVKAIVNARLNGAGEAKVGEMLRAVEGGAAVDVDGLLGAIRSRWPGAWAFLDRVFDEASQARWTIRTPEGVEVIVPDDKRDRAHVPAGWLQATEVRLPRSRGHSLM